MTQPKANSGCALFGFLIAGIVSLSFCTKDNSSTEYGAADQSTDWSAGGGAAEPEYKDFDPENLKRVGKTAAAIARLDIDGADRLFSENCFDSVREAFSWAKLDRCGAFDAIASRWAAGDVYDSSAYFSSESAAGRYLELAGKHQADSAVIDQRWASIQGATAGVRKPTKAVAAPVVEVDTVMNDIDSADVVSE